MKNLTTISKMPEDLEKKLQKFYRCYLLHLKIPYLCEDGKIVCKECYTENRDELDKS